MQKLFGLLALASPGALALPPQSVTLTAPVQGAEISLISPSPTVTLSASAVASSGNASIVSVDFRVNGTSVGTDVAAPFSVAWQPTAPGTYIITAVATDSSSSTTNNTLPSAPATVTISAVRTIAVTSPSANAGISQHSEIFLRSNAAMSDGVIASVDFIVSSPAMGSLSLGTVNRAPYNLACAVELIPDHYSLIARATASDGTTTFDSAPIPINVVVAIGDGPAVSLTAPTPANAVVGSDMVVSATAIDADGFIPITTPGGVTFYADGEPIGTDLTAPYTITWTPTIAKAVSLRAQAIDDKGNSRLSAPAVIAVAQSTTTLAVTLTTPTSGATPSVNTPVTLAANAVPNSGATINQVQFLAGAAIIGSATSPPYSIVWTPTSTGNVTLTARVFESSGNSQVSAAVPVTVITPPAAAVAVTLSPSNPNIPAGTARLVTVTLAPSVSAERVELYYDGQFIGSDISVPYSFLFTAPNSFGPHSLGARAVGAGGIETSSAPLPIFITAASGGAPVVSIVTPSTGAFVGVATGSPPTPATVITGTASDSEGGIASVQVFVNGSPIGTVTPAGATWSLNWTPTSAGAASIVAVATDNSGNAVASPAVSVTVADSTAPALTLTLSPRTAAAPGSPTLPSGAVRNLVADALASAGRAIVRVEFFVDGTKVDEDTLAPYTYRYAAPALTPGELSHTFVLSARATDNAGAARDAQIPVLVIAPIGQPPAVSLLTPSDGAAATPNTPVSLAATAVANGGTIASVQFYVNGSPGPINSGNALTAAPYAATFIPAAPGSYTIDAIATDDRGNTTVSNAATITASFATPTIVFTSPNPNAVARATPNVPLTLSATATVQGGAGAAVLLVEFLLDGAQIGARTTPNTANGTAYSVSWVPTVAQLGEHVLTARVTDTHSQIATSAPVTVNVASVVGTPPTVSVTASPVPTLVGLQTASTVNFIATAVATGAGSTVRNVEIFLNDLSIGLAAREQTTNLYRLAYDFNRFDFTALTPVINETTGAVTYPVRLYAIARDTNNNQTVSAPANLVLNAATSGPPSLQLQAQSPTSITAGTQFFVAASFDDLDGVVTSIQLYANGTPVGAAAVNPQQGQLLTYAANNAGRFNLFAVATDDTGNTVVSRPSIVVNVTAISAPATSITRPADNSTVTTVAAPVFLEGTAVNSASNQVPSLQFIATAAGGARQVINGIRVGTTTTYRAVWMPANPDTYTVTTLASVGTVQGTSTASRRVVVNNIAGLAPSVTLTRAAGTSGVPTTATTASRADFAATATDPDGAVVEVEFFLNRHSIGPARRDPQGNTWRITAEFAGLQPGATEVVALARDSSGNVVASPTSNINVTAASSIGPSITISPSKRNPAFNRQVQLQANARDTDGTINTVQYFANATAIASSTNAGALFLTNWTPASSGVYYLWAVATDNSGITAVSPTVEIVVRRNNPVLENAAFILQTYQDIADTTNINPLVFDGLDEQLGAGSLSRADLVVSLLGSPGFDEPINLLAAYHVLMGQWPTPQNYATLLATARTDFSNAVGGILSSNEYAAKYGATPTVALLNNPASVIPADTFIARLWQGAGLPGPSAAQNVAFRSNPTALPNLGRGYGPAGLNAAVAEFITNTNSGNAALFARARAAALFYQLTRPPVTVTTEEITQRVNALLILPDPKAVAGAILQDVLYGYRYVTITSHPQSLTVAPRSGVLFQVGAEGAPPLVYQWLLNGAPIPGASGSILSLTNVDASRVGSYSAVITSSAGVATSDAAVLSISTAPTKLANISTRGTTTGAGADVLIGGFVVRGTGNQTRQMLIRVVGPTLGRAPFNLTGFLADPRLEVYRGNDATPILSNDNWGTQAGGTAMQVNAIRQATTRAGAFVLENNSADAAVLAALTPGNYTVQAKSPAGDPNATGVVLIEVYDVTQGGPPAPKATNVSTRGVVGTGANLMIAGFVVQGETSRRMLIRGAGPTLQMFGLPAASLLADPQLTLVEESTGRTIRTNDDWASGEDAAIIAQAATSAGAFPFANGSRDSAIIVMIPPGAYTVQLRGASNGTGIGIVEVYDVDP